jgi:hypothetical protein
MTPLDDDVPLFGRRVPVAALTLLLRLEDEGYDIRVDGHELCIKPAVPAHERQGITHYKPYLILLVEQTLLLIERERVAEQDETWELI